MQEEGGASRYPCGNADESGAHIGGECKLHKEGRNVLEEQMGKIDGCDMETFGTFYGSE